MIKQKDPKNESMESFMITEGVTGNKHGSEDEIRSNSRICTPNDSRPSLALFGLDSPDVTKYSQSGLAHPDQFKDTNNYMPYEKSPLSVAHPAESLKGSSSSLSKVPSKSAMKKTASSSRALNGYESASMINEMPFQDEATRDLALEELAIKPTNNEHIIDGSEHDLKQPEIKSKEVVNLPLQSRGNVNLSSSSLKTRPARSATTPTESQKSITSATRHSETSLQTSLTNLNQKAAEGNRESTHASGEDRMQSQPDLNAYSARNHSHTSAFSTDAILDATKIAASPPKSPERIASQVSVRMSRQSLNQCIADDANGLSHPVEVKRISSKRNSVKFEKNDRDRESNTVASSSPQFVPLRDSTPSLQQSRHHSLNGLGATEVVGHGNADEGLSQHTLIQEDEVHFQSDFIATEPSSPKASRPQSASTTRTKHSLTESQQVPNGPLEDSIGGVFD
ncbi:hypothetical protein BC830DRAFT_71845 [Chytriomyces sp. MP71]|nr:hypothetical protein BC830DRAFT_71845 [Chytriomyces sp. MP71]